MSSCNCNNIIFLSILIFGVTIHIANSTVDGVVEDPCTPKGYIYDTHSQKDSSGFLSEESKFKASLQVQAAGDFTKCRSATLAMLQEGKGK